MAIQGVQNLSGITFNKGTNLPTTVLRIGDETALDNVDGTGWQQGDSIFFGTINNNNYYITGTGTTIISSGSGNITNIYVSSGITGDITQVYNISGIATGNFVNIEAFGAVRGGDSTIAIQNAVNAAFVSGFGIFVPPYRYAITGTIYLPNKEGIKFQGAGGGYAGFTGSNLNPLDGNKSVIFWSGANNGLMMQWAGLGVSWDALSLWGASPSGSNRAATGILITKTGAGSAPGQHDVKSITIMNCKVAVSCAPSGDFTMNNCEQSRWGMMYIIDCEQGFQLNSQQAMGHMVDSLNFYRLYTTGNHSAVTVFGGGTLYADNCLSLAPNFTLLDIRGPGPGHNNGAFVFKNVKFDNGSSGSSKLLDMRNYTGTPNLDVPVLNVRFQDVKVSPTTYAAETGFLVHAYSCSRVILDNIDKLQPGMIRMASQTAGTTVYAPNVQILNSRTWLDITGGTAATGIIDAARSSGTYYWSMQNLCNFSGIPVRNTGNYVL